MTVPGSRVVAVVGPTATGKSNLAVDLALALGGEVVGADASQLYRGMDIGTAKLSPAERRGVPHHQLDVLDVTDEANIASYQRHSRADIESVLDRGGVPVLTGGSGLYVRAALDVLEIPPTDPAVRARIEQELADEGLASLRARLAELDPQAAARIEPGNARRHVRALEVVELTGRPFSASMPSREYLRPAVAIGLDLDTAVLDDRVGRRAVAMWRDGLLDEVRSLLGRGLRLGRTASGAIGYAQAIAELDGEVTEESAIAATAQATRRLVRRQRSWFRADPRITWLDAASPTLLADALRVIGAGPGRMSV